MPEYSMIELEFGSTEEGEVDCRLWLGGVRRCYYRDAAWNRRFEFLDTTRLDQQRLCEMQQGWLYL